MNPTALWRSRGPRRLRWRPPGPLGNQRGAGFVGIVVVLLILLVLVMGYVRLHMGGERAKRVTAVDASRGVACRVQRQQLERDIMVWSVDHPDDPPSIPALAASGLRVPSCPEGGQYSVTARAVVCSVHR